MKRSRLTQITGKDWPYRLAFFVLLIIIFGFAYRNVLPWHTLAICDLIPWFPDVGATYDNFSSSWSDIYLGRVMPITPGTFLLQASLTTLTGGDAGTAQGIFYLSLLPLSAITMYLFLRHIISSNLGCILASVLYGVNGLTIEWFLAGGQALLPLHAFFPLLMLYLIKVLEEKQGRILNILIFSLLVGLIASFQVYMTMLWLFLPFIIVFFILEVISQRNLKYTISTTSSFIVSAVILLLFLAPILIDQVQNLIGYYFAPDVSVFAGGYTKDYLVDSIKINYTLSYTTDMFNRYTYIIIPFAFFALFLRKSKGFRYYLSFLLLGALILLFSKLLTFDWILDLFRNIPILFVIRSPSKFAFMLCWTIFPMLGILVNEIQRGLHTMSIFRQRWKQIIVSFSLCAVLILPSLLVIRADNAAPFNSSYNNVIRFLQGSSGLGDEDLGLIPESFDRVQDWLNKHREEEGFFRTLWLPGSRTVMNKVVLRYDPMTLAQTSSDLGVTALSLMPLLRSSTEDIGKLLTQFDVKYIVVSFEKWEGQDYIQPNYQGAPRIAFREPFGCFVIGDPERYVELLNKQKDLRLVASNPDFLIYENLDFITSSHVLAYNRMFFIAPMSSIATEQDWAQKTIEYASFENGMAPWVTEETLKGAKYFIDNTESVSGLSSLRIEMHEKGSYASIYNYTNVKGRTNYHLSLWGKGENTNTAFVRIFFRDNENRIIEQEGENYLGLNLSLTEELTKSENIVRAPRGAAQMLISIDMGMEWSFMDESKPAIVWFDDITISEMETSMNPALDWNYLYGYPASEEGFPHGMFEGWTGAAEDFPTQYLKGQMMVRIPELLSNIPYLNDKHHLLVYGDFLSSDETINQSLALSNAVIFLGDVDSSQPYEKWTGEAEALLFVYEAESELILKPVEQNGSNASNLLVDDNPVSFWKTGVSREGSIGSPDISNSSEQKIAGADSLSINVGSGEGASWYIYHKFPDKQDWSGSNSLSLYWYGGGSDGTIRADVVTTDYDVFQATFKDNFSGWRRITLPFSSFSILGNPSWDDINMIGLQMLDDNLSGAWYLDRVSITSFSSFEYSYIEGDSFGYDTAIEIKGACAGEMRFLNPRAGYIRLLVRAQNGQDITANIDGQHVAIANSYPTDNGFILYETSPLYLDEGEYKLTLGFEGDRTIVDQILLLSTKQEDTTFAAIFASKQLTLDYVEVSPSQYNLKFKSDEPSLLILKGSFHPEWQAYTSSGERLEHISALTLGWANGFYLDHGIDGEVTVAFDRQESREVAIVIWVATLTLLLLVIGSLVITRVIKSRHRPSGNRAKD